MSTDRRTFIGQVSGSLATAALATHVEARPTPPQVRKIATEEAFATPELAAAWLAVARGDPSASLDNQTAINFIFNNPLPGSNPGRFRRQLLDLDSERLAIMDQAGVDMHLLAIFVSEMRKFWNADGVFTGEW